MGSDCELVLTFAQFQLGLSGHVQSDRFQLGNLRDFGPGKTTYMHIVAELTIRLSWNESSRFSCGVVPRISAKTYYVIIFC